MLTTGNGNSHTVVGVLDMKGITLYNERTDLKSTIFCFLRRHLLVTLGIVGSNINFILFVFHSGDTVITNLFFPIILYMGKCVAVDAGGIVYQMSQLY